MHTIWELAHGDGTSIFVKQGVCISGTQGHLIFGPFLYLSQDQMDRNPPGCPQISTLMAPLTDMPVQAQQIDVEWVIQNAQKGFPPVGPDCMIVGNTLVPLTLIGAQVADKYQTDGPWTALANLWGVPALRTLNAGLVHRMVEGMADPRHH